MAQVKGVFLLTVPQVIKFLFVVFLRVIVVAVCSTKAPIPLELGKDISCQYVIEVTFYDSASDLASSEVFLIF